MMMMTTTNCEHCWRRKFATCTPQTEMIKGRRTNQKGLIERVGEGRDRTNCREEICWKAATSVTEVAGKVKVNVKLSFA